MSQPDPNAAFASFVPGFEFLQNLAQQASAGMAGMGNLGGMGAGAAASPSAMAGMAQLSQWVAPTFDVEELDRRIKDLKAVHFWLDQNTKALSATIQALEVQRMTLATLQGMNVSLNEVAESMKIRPVPAPAPAPVAAPQREPEPEDDTEDAAEHEDGAPSGEAQTKDRPAAAPGVDPMQWWGSLTQQFQAIAQNTLQEMSAQAAQLQAAQARATDAAPRADKGAASKAAAKNKTAARTAAKTAVKPAVKAPPKGGVKASPKAKPAARPAGKAAPGPTPAATPARKRWPA